ncbi:MAG: hypothetical protein V4498_02815 [candidate division FCPU426 bacterium]
MRASGPLTKKDLAAVKEFGAQIRAARDFSIANPNTIVILDPKKLAVEKHHLAPKNLKVTWQKVHSADPKRNIYREHLKAATGADRVSSMATTPSGLMLSGRCSRVTKRNGLLQVMGFFQVLAP